MTIPFVDLKAQMVGLREEIESRIGEVLDRGDFILGKDVFSFEEHFAAFTHSKFALGVGNGTDALHLAFRASGMQPGDEAILPANTFVATAIGVLQAGGKPVLVDCDPNTFHLDPSKLEAALTAKTRFIVPVHLYGRMMDLAPIEAFAKEHGLAMIEDCAQAHGAKLAGRGVGTIGDYGCYSFYPGKNLGAYGDAGAVTTESEERKAKIEALRNYGSVKKYHHPVFGLNSRLDTIQAAVLDVKLGHLARWSAERAEVARSYNSLLAGVGDLVLPEDPEDGSHVYHLYVVQTARRDELLSFLQDNGVAAGIHYPVPIHLQEMFADRGWKKGDFPETERLAGQILSLPIFAELSAEQIAYTVEKIRAFFD